MPSPKKHPVFYGVLGLLVAAIVAEGVVLYQAADKANRAQSETLQKENELAGYARRQPFPDSENALAIDAELARIEVERQKMQAELKGRGEIADEFAAATPPATRTQAYFEVADFVQEMRRLATERGVNLRAEERFSFSAYAHEGPEADLINPIFRQTQTLEYILRALFEAKPVNVVSVQRERPLSPAMRQAIQDAQASGQSLPQAFSPTGEIASDYFEIDPSVTARVPGFVDATAYRLQFVGQTSTLRDLLNKLGTFELPLVVRSVEVLLATDEQRRIGAPTEPTGGLEAGPRGVFRPEPRAGAGPRVGPRPETPFRPNPQNPFGGAPANPFGGPAAPGAIPEAPAAVQLVPETFSLFTVTVEFIDLVKPEGSEQVAEANP